MDPSTDIRLTRGGGRATGIATGAVSRILPGIALLGLLTLLCTAESFFSLREMPSAGTD